MSLFTQFFGFESKDTTSINPGSPVPIPVRSSEEIEAALNGEFDSSVDPRSLSVVYACARVIAEGLAIPPVYLNRVDKQGRTAATELPLYHLLLRSPNARQTAYEFREQIGWHLALNGNAFVWLNRAKNGKGAILEMLPMDPGAVQITVPTKLGAPVQYSLYGVPVARDQIWHLRGPAWLNTEGSNLLRDARKAIGLANYTQNYGTNLFKNGTQVAGIIGIKGETSAAQIEQIRSSWNGRHRGAANSGKTAFLPADINYTPLTGSASDAQWIESRRFQIEEICRFFRVSPTKVFQSLGSQSYASVEQAHIAHDADTDAHWHERFIQSANKNLITDAERRSGLELSIDNRASLRGTAAERMTYYQLGIANGIFTRNEVREMEGFDRSTDPTADTLTPAANLFGPAE